MGTQGYGSKASMALYPGYNIVYNPSREGFCVYDSAKFLGYDLP